MINKKVIICLGVAVILYLGVAFMVGVNVGHVKKMESEIRIAEFGTPTVTPYYRLVCIQDIVFARIEDENSISYAGPVGPCPGGETR
jgi:hypothetical protein